MQPAAGIEPAASWQVLRGELAAPTQHNGLFGKVAAVAALKLRLVLPPLRALRVYQTPVMSCAPSRLRARPARTRCSARRALRLHGQCGIGCAETASVPVRRFARSSVLAPAHPVGPGACAPWARAGLWPVRPPRGLPATPALGVCVGPCRHKHQHPNNQNRTAMHGAARRASTPAAKSKRGKARAWPSARVGQNVPLGKNLTHPCQPSSANAAKPAPGLGKMPVSTVQVCRAQLCRCSILKQDCSRTGIGSTTPGRAGTSSPTRSA